jgi:hypothetical protein
MLPVCAEWVIVDIGLEDEVTLTVIPLASLRVFHLLLSVIGLILV